MKVITYFIVLEKRCDLKGQKEVSGLVAKISRAIGTPSTSLLPPNVPRWALMRESMLYICFFYILIFILQESLQKIKKIIKKMNKCLHNVYLFFPAYC